MAGGVGSRFWPISTDQYPKQFIDITACGRTMIQQAYDRFAGIIDVENVWVVTSAGYKDLVLEQLPGIRPEHILLEPCMRNTAPCVAYVSWKIRIEDPEALVVMAPSDHLVLNVPAFQDAIRRGLDFVAEGKRILTLGMTPTRPETGYGYIEQEPSSCSADGICKVAMFREKPDLPTAIDYIRRGGFTWNSGMFLWKVGTIVEELRLHAPQIAEVMGRMAGSFFTEREQQTVNELFPSCEKISIDYAVMEKTDIAYVLPAEFGWSDLGTWGSLHAVSPKDENGNAVVGDGVKLVDCQGNMIKMPDGKQVIIQGLKNCIVVEHNDTLLVCQLSEEQRIKEWHE